MLKMTVSENLASFTLPRIPAMVTRRRGLIDRISENHAVTVLTAPTGFGKTTAITAWLEENFGPEKYPETAIAWVDGEKVTTPNKREEILETIEARLESDAEWLVLVVDSYDLIDDQEWDQALLDLVRRYRNLRLFVTGRDAERHLNWRAPDLDIDVITGRDLGFNETETRDLLRRIYPGVTDAVVQEIHEKVGGWPILVRAVGLARGDTRAAIEYLRTDRSLGISNVRRQFVLATAITLDFDEEMASFLSGSKENDDMIEKLVAAGLLTPIYRNGEQRYRYLPAVAQAALAEMSKTELQTRLFDLATWCSENERPEDAIYYGIKSEQWDMVPGLLHKHGRVLTESDLVREALETIDSDMANIHPILAGLLDVIAGPNARTGNVPDLGHRETDSPAETFASLITKAGYLRFNGDFVGSRAAFDDAEKFLSEHANVPEVAAMVPMAQVQASLLYLLTDELLESAKRATAAYRNARERKLVTETRNAIGVLALVNVLGGNGAHATEWLERLDATPPTTGMFRDMADTCAHVARVLVHLGRLDLPAAESALAHLNPATSMDEMWPFIVLAQSDYALLTGKSVQGLRDLEAAVIAHPNFERPGTLIQPMLAAARANLLLAQGGGNRALASLGSAEAAHPLVRAVRARIELLRGEHQRAITIAHVSSDWDRAHGRALRELRLITAIAHLHAGEPIEAGRVFRTVIADDGAGLLRALAMVDRSSVARLVAETGVGGSEFESMSEKVPEPPFVERLELATLTPREQLVLTLLHEDLTMGEIAAQLVVSGNTIKSQVRSLYRKLGVNSREEAVKRAAEYGLVN